MTHLAGAHDDDVRPAGLVLVVDDEEAVRAVMRRALERVGWGVEQASDGTSALHLLNSGRHDWRAVILDLSLPDMSGQELFEAIREEHPGLVARIAFTSGAPTAFAENSGRPLLHKPFEITTLRELVQRLASGG